MPGWQEIFAKEFNQDYPGGESTPAVWLIKKLIKKWYDTRFIATHKSTEQAIAMKDEVKRDDKPLITVL